jgi:hypothetical protein
VVKIELPTQPAHTADDGEGLYTGHVRMRVGP